MSTQLDIASLVNQQIRQTLNEYLAGIDLKSLIEQAMVSAVGDVVAKLSVKTADTMIKNRDLPGEVLKMAKNKVDSHVDSHVKSSIRTIIAATDVKKMVAEEVSQQLAVNIKQYEFPDASVPSKSIDWTDAKFSGNMIDGGIVRNFNSSGIQDNATECQLTIVDGVIVAERHFISRSLQTDKISTKELEVEGMLDIRGPIKAGAAATKMISDIVKTAVNERLNTSISIADGKIMHDNRLLIDYESLGPGVMSSNLRKLGLLQDLRVSGISKFSETMMISDKKRVGINTDEPAGALTIWDEDAELTVVKDSQRLMYVGSTRNTNLALGTNNRKQITLHQDLIDIADPVMLQGIRFSVEDRIPERAGLPLEIVMVRSAREGQPRFYICNGGNQWQSLGA